MNVALDELRGWERVCGGLAGLDSGVRGEAAFAGVRGRDEGLRKTERRLQSEGSSSLRVDSKVKNLPSRDNSLITSRLLSCVRGCPGSATPPAAGSRLLRVRFIYGRDTHPNS